MSSKVVTATYDAEHNVLRLVEPLEGVQDEARVMVTVDAVDDQPTKSIRDFRGCLTGENGEEFAALVDEMFPVER